MMISLRLAGKLRVYLLCFRWIHEYEGDNEAMGKSAGQIISEVTSDGKYPVFTGFPAGHIDDNRGILYRQQALIENTR